MGCGRNAAGEISTRPWQFNLTVLANQAAPPGIWTGPCRIGHCRNWSRRAVADPDWIAIRRDMAHNVMMTEPDWLVGVLRDHVL